MTLKKTDVQAALDAAKDDAKYFGKGFIEIASDGEIKHIPYMNTYRDNKNARMKIREYQNEIKRLKQSLEAWRNSRP